MRPLTASELLQVWEEGQSRNPYEQALLLLEAACPEQSRKELAMLSIGSRDARLLTLRELTFGERMASVASCPACGMRLEFSINVADVRIPASDTRGEGIFLEQDDYLINFRLPCSLDLQNAGVSRDRESMTKVLMQQCICKARHQDEEISTDRLPLRIVEAVVAKMAECDPQADTHLSLSCPGCNHRWQAFFDIVSFLWSEIHSWATRILREVHLLASAYGWREADILAISPLRRHIYLEMAGQ